MDKHKAAALVGLALVGCGAWWYLRQRQASAAAPGDGAAGGDPFAGFNFDSLSLDSILNTATSAATSAAYSVADTVQNVINPGGWTPPASAGPYLDQVYAVEVQYGMPHNFLARQIYQESRFRPDIINGGPNGAGAIGISQIIPRWNPGVDPHDPVASINYMGKKMADLYRAYGDWKLALAAYNWGEGNLAKVGNNIASAPLETRNYVADISAAVGLA